MRHPSELSSYAATSDILYFLYSEGNSLLGANLPLQQEIGSLADHRPCFHAFTLPSRSHSSSSCSNLAYLQLWLAKIHQQLIGLVPPGDVDLLRHLHTVTLENFNFS
ncbi:hypothetical protein BHE74_00006799 [Ensete ventricosum]|nr:hypothetical protein BHE74_00006799 [Ensete ventricosum]RZR77408.1 hypothetical protein BHM03_00002474 [Ensete ventricosum]